MYWIQFELLWRDYFYYVSQKFSKLRPFATERLRKARKMTPDDPDPSEAGTASTLFNIGGFQEVLKPKESAKVIDSWNGFNLSDPKDKARLFFEGNTGVPFIDAALREISATGYMYNRMRQNVASYFAVDLYVDWRVGAEWFETLLCDHDVCSNSGNWQYQASGVGLDARASRKFNQIKQANDYDLHDEYVKTWIPAIRDLDEMHVQTPWCESGLSVVIMFHRANGRLNLCLASCKQYFRTRKSRRSTTPRNPSARLPSGRNITVPRAVEAVAETARNREAGMDPVGLAKARVVEAERVAIEAEVESIEAGVAVEVADPRVVIESSTSRGSTCLR